MSSESAVPTPIIATDSDASTASSVLAYAAGLLSEPSRSFVLVSASREIAVGDVESRLIRRLSILISDAVLSAWAEMEPWEAGPSIPRLPMILRNIMAEVVEQGACAPDDSTAQAMIASLSRALTTRIDVGDVENLLVESSAVSRIFVLWLVQEQPA